MEAEDARQVERRGGGKAKKIWGMTPKERDTIQPFLNIWKPLAATATAEAATTTAEDATKLATTTAEANSEAAKDIVYARKDSFRVYINNREEGWCAITGKKVNCHAAHVLPLAPLAVKQPKRFYFWVLVVFCLVACRALRAELRRLLGGPRSDNVGNGFYLKPTLHDGYGRLRFCLRADGHGELGQSVISSQRPSQLT